MIAEFEYIISRLFQKKEEEGTFSIYDPVREFDVEGTANASVAQAINAAFLIILAGSSHPVYERAKGFLTQLADSSKWGDIVNFYLNGVDLIRGEIDSSCRQDHGLANSLRQLFDWVSDTGNSADSDTTVEYVWSVFCPEAAGIRSDEQECIKILRQRRTLPMC